MKQLVMHGNTGKNTPSIHLPIPIESNIGKQDKILHLKSQTNATFQHALYK